MSVFVLFSVLAGLFFVSVGLSFKKWPTMFRRGIWLKTSIAIRVLSEDGYIKYMRRVGTAYICLGAVFVLFGLLIGILAEFLA